MHALVDGDILVYRCGFAAEVTHYTVIDNETGIPIKTTDDYEEVRSLDKELFSLEREKEVHPVSHALANVNTTLRYIEEKLGTTKRSVFLSGGTCFRHSQATLLGYKENRKDAPKPVHYAAIRDYLVEHKGASVFSSIEADDALALGQGKDTVIVSIDKDLLQVPGKHFNWVKAEKFSVPPEVAIKKKYQQVLTGDSTDNIPGIYKVGPVAARNLLKEVAPTDEALYKACCARWETFMKAGVRTPEVLQPDGDVWVHTETLRQYTIQDIVNEILLLVTVGGPNAEQALREAGEALPITRGA